MDPHLDWQTARKLNSPTRIIPVMRQRPIDGYHGYVLHESCWKLLESFFTLHDVPIDRLLQVCKSLPFPLRYTGVSWGHGYEGITSHDSEKYYPWEDGEDYIRSRSEEVDVYRIAKTDPFNIPNIQGVVANSAQSPSSGVFTQGTDCFARLPWELLEAVAIYLPTKDALNIRLASKSFLPIFHSQTFWVSRFLPTNECGYILEARNSEKQRDWRMLYRAAVNLRGEDVQNRKRVWSLIQEVANLLDLINRPESCSIGAQPGKAHCRLSIASANLKQVPMEGVYSSLFEECTLIGSQSTRVPPKLSSLAATVLHIGNSTFLSGIRLISAEEPTVCLGYQDQSKEAEYGTDAVYGFVLAIGSRGIHALQIIKKDGIRSPWLGSPKGAAITERLAHMRPVGTLAIGYDVSFPYPQSHQLHSDN